MENFTIFHVKVVEKFNWTALRYILHVYEVEKYNWITLGYFMPTKWKIGKFLNKNYFRSTGASVLIFLRVNTIEYKLITLLSWSLQNQFGVGYWATSY